MVANRGKKYERLGDRYGSCLGIVLLLIVAVAAGWFFSLRSTSTLDRTTLVLAADPMVVLSWERDSGRFILLSIPADTVIEAVHGYGKYSLGALWSLGKMHPNEHDLLRLSMEQAFGLPIPWYSGPSGKTIAPHEVSMSFVRQALGFSRFQQLGTGSVQTNLPLPLYLRLWWALRFARADDVRILDLGAEDVVSPEVQPDGTFVNVLDIRRLDTALGDMFQEEAIRRQRTSVAVYNTTPQPLLAERVGRMLSHLGFFVVTVGNQLPTVDRCIATGKKSMLDGDTAQLIIRLFECEKQYKEDTERADIVLLVGSRYAQIFQPPVAK